MAQAGDAGDLVDGFNYTNKRGVPYFPHTNDMKANIAFSDWDLEQALDLDSDSDEETDYGYDKDQWSTVEIQVFRKRQVISQAIKKLNEDGYQYSSQTAADSDGKDPDDWTD